MNSKIRELSILTKARSLKNSECTSDSINGIVKSMKLLDVSCSHTNLYQYKHISFSSEVLTQFYVPLTFPRPCHK
jgi:hypothetical protein